MKITVTVGVHICWIIVTGIFPVKSIANARVTLINIVTGTVSQKDAMAQGPKKGSIPRIHFFPHMSLGFTAALPEKNGGFRGFQLHE